MPGIAGILHSDAIAGPEVGLERELDAIERTAHHRHVLARDAIALEASSGKLEQLGVGPGSAVQHRFVRQRDEGRAEIRQERGVGIAGQEVNHTGRNDGPAAWGGRNPRSDGGARAGRRRRRGRGGAAPGTRRRRWRC